MPLSDIPPDAPAKRADALRQARAKILDKAQRKFLFEFQEFRAPSGVIVENGAMVGVNFSRTEVDGQVRTCRECGDRARADDDKLDRQHPGTDSRNSAEGRGLYLCRSEVGLLMDGPTAVFAAGNVLTGKGNIKDSLESGTEIGTRVAEAYLGLSGEELKIAEGARKEAAAWARRSRARSARVRRSRRITSRDSSATSANANSPSATRATTAPGSPR